VVLYDLKIIFYPGELMRKKFLVTPALPYANGPLHLGHLLEHIQVNIFVRSLRMDEQDVLYVCGADSHGTPIEINALKAGISPSEFAKKWQESFAKSLQHFGIEFDGGYGSTHTKENEEHAQRIFLALKAKGFVQTREIEQLFDPKLKRFLPDRMVCGICPKCKAKDQYGDSCEACGRTYQPTELIDPKSVLSGITPELKTSLHYFVSLSQFENELQTWVNTPGTIHDDTKAFLKHWFKEGLKDWDISRDGPYFGFLIPKETNKYFYVWLDAPIGYISLSERAAALRGRSFDDYWLDKNTKIIHFIGKDIVYFHTLFWPAMLMAAGYTLPSQIVVHGMLTINGEKMSKSRATFILGDTFSKHIDPEALRYYFACKLNKRSEDIDLHLIDFMQRVNTDLVNKVINLISRVLPLLHRYFEGKASQLDPNAMWLTNKAEKLVDEVKEFFLDNEPARAVHEIVRYAEEANRYLQDEAPWKLVKENPTKAHNILTTGLYVGKVCFALLKPVMPKAVELLEKMINEGNSFKFSNIANHFSPNVQFKPYEHLFERIDERNIKALVEESKMTINEEKNMTPNIGIDQFMEVDLRAAKVISAEAVLESDKLIDCTLDVGELGNRRVFSGLRPHILPEQLVGKIVVLVANLAPRKMRFGISEGMILAVGEKKPIPVFIDEAIAGERVR
jgi:methionyl-tRNA synthetase